MRHVAVYLDSHSAKLFAMETRDSSPTNVSEHHHGEHHHHGACDHNEDRKKFFKKISHDLLESEEIFLMGPKEVLSAFEHYCADHQKNVSKKIVGKKAVESHSSNHDLWAHGHNFFVERLNFQAQL